MFLCSLSQGYNKVQQFLKNKLIEKMFTQNVFSVDSYEEIYKITSLGSFFS